MGIAVEIKLAVKEERKRVIETIDKILKDEEVNAQRHMGNNTDAWQGALSAVGRIQEEIKRTLK